MTQEQAPAPDKAVSTGARLGNGVALTGTAMAVVWALETYLGAPTGAAVAGAAILGGVQAVLGSAARDQIEESPPKTFLGKVGLRLLAHLG